MVSDIHNQKQELHQLIDQLSNEQISAALRYMHSLRADPVLLSLLNAPRDDEPYTEAQRRHDSDAQESITRGEGVSHEEILREFGF